MILRMAKSTFSNVFKYLGLLEYKDRKKVLYIAIVQILSGFLDLLGIIVIGFIGTLAISGIQNNVNTGGVNSILQKFGMGDYSLQVQIAILSIVAVFVLLSKTIFSLYFTRKIISFFSTRAAQLSTKLIARLLKSSLLTIQKKSVQENLYALTTGVEVIMLQVLSTVLVVISDMSLLIILIVTLFFVDQLTTILTFIIFGIIGSFLYFRMHKKARALGSMSSLLTIKSSNGVVEALSAFREIVVKNKRNYYVDSLSKTRYEIADARAQINFMPYISKYVVEFSVVLVAVIIGAIQFLFNNSIAAISTIGIFLAAGTRIAPALLRIQQGLIAISTSHGQAIPTLELIRYLDSVNGVSKKFKAESSGEGFTPSIKLEDVSFGYEDYEPLNLIKINLNIQAGQFVAIVGPSGSGKTTLIDVILGLLPIKSGKVLISNKEPDQAIHFWPGSISYVPQDVFLSNSSIRENVALGVDKDEISDDLVIQALRSASLGDFLDLLPEGLDTLVGENGSKFSGGQRQRLGIARALYTNPKIILLDEATSSLDAETERSVSNSLSALKGERTLVVIAHRLSTIKDADLVVYLENGHIMSTGTFEQVRNDVPDFESQAQIMGL